jgi:CRISPR system Cascade subunit CasA
LIPAFNLLDEPWLPVCFADGTVSAVGLLDLFDQVGHIRSLAETSPPSLIACDRLLLAE